MKTFKIVDGDLVFDQSGNLKMVSGKDELAQAVELRLLANKGEWFGDRELGLEYSEITDKLKTKKDIEFAIRETVYQEERIEEVEFTLVDIDEARRTLRVKFEMTTEDGELLENEVII